MLGAFQFCRADYEFALGSPASEPDSQSGGFYNAYPNSETHPSQQANLRVENLYGMILYSVVSTLP